MTALPISFAHFGCGTLGAFPGVKLNQDLLKKRRKSGRQATEAAAPRRAARPVAQPPLVAPQPAVRPAPAYANSAR